MWMTINIYCILRQLPVKMDITTLVNDQRINSFISHFSFSIILLWKCLWMVKNQEACHSSNRYWCICTVLYTAYSTAPKPCMQGTTASTVFRRAFGYTSYHTERNAACCWACLKNFRGPRTEKQFGAVLADLFPCFPLVGRWPSSHFAPTTMYLISL